MSIQTTVSTFDHQNGGDWPGNRGVVMDTEAGYTGRVFSTRMPSLWITDSGDVELDEMGGRWPAEDVLAWLEAAAAAIRSREV
jgi:hypothetical protein